MIKSLSNKYFSKVTIPYKSGTRKFKIRTPVRRKCIKGLTRKSYYSTASSMVNSTQMLKALLYKLSLKIKIEMKSISSDEYDSILRDHTTALKHFHWDTIVLDLLKGVPTLMAFLAHLISKPAFHKPLLCLLASQILKARHQHMGLVQRAISMMMYGNGTAKQVRSPQQNTTTT